MTIFETHLNYVINAIADDALSEKTKQYAINTIKEAINVYIIKDDEIDPGVYERLISYDFYSRNSHRAEQRKDLGKITEE